MSLSETEINDRLRIHLDDRREHALHESDVTASWLTACISQTHPGVSVVGCEPDDFVVGMSGKLRVKVQYDEGGKRLNLPDKLVVKAGFGLYSADFDFLYVTEMRSYRDILPSLEVNRPVCVFAGREPLQNTPVVILEDLRAKNAHFCSAMDCLTYEQAAGFIDQMAGYHSALWDSAELKPGGKYDWTYKTHSGGLLTYFEHSLTPAVWDRYMIAPRAAGAPRMLKDRHRMRAALDALGRFHDVNPKCLVHGDAHVGNAYLEPGDRPGFLDWQLKQAPWFQDFTFFLVSALDVIDRRNWERSLVSRYVRQLASLGVSALSFEEAWLGYRREISYGLFIWLVNSSDMQPEHIAAANAARFNMAAVDHDSLSLLT